MLICFILSIAVVTIITYILCCMCLFFNVFVLQAQWDVVCALVVCESLVNQAENCLLF